MMHVRREDRVAAILLSLGPRRRAALPVHLGMEIVEQPAITPVPGARAPVLGLLKWQGQWLPVLSLLQADGEGGGAAAASLPYALVCAWQAAPGLPLQHGALALAALPGRVEVDDLMACALPEDDLPWQRLALACFRYQEAPVPVLSTAALFARAWELPGNAGAGQP